MDIKINSRERFHAITLPGPSLSATMTGEIEKGLLPFLQNEVKNIVLILKNIQQMDREVADKIDHIQQIFYKNNASFVICELQDSVKPVFERSGLPGHMNITPTESEAWDIVQMEEIERELLADGES